jgi:hypothetical protein
MAKNGRDEKGRYVKGHTENLGKRYETKYDDSFCDKIWDFVEQRQADGLPITDAGIAVFFGVCLNTIQNWQKEHPDFGIVMQKVNAIRRDDYETGGSTGRYNPQFSKFIMSACFGLSEKAETDNNVTMIVKIDEGVDEESN